MVKQITRDDLVRMMSLGETLKIVDVLSKESYEKEHIKGAISIPLANIGRESLKMFKYDDFIVTYCANFDCKASTMAAQKLAVFGYTNVFDYKGGIKDYKEAGLPIEGVEYVQQKTCGQCQV